MLMYHDYFRPYFCKSSFFAGANTPGGFVGEYENLLSEDTFEKVYIIKGGSGTGKSTLIKECAAKSEKKGADVTYIRCSSDPDSLDGAIIAGGEKSIAVIDGTAPHTRDPKYGGACGEIINCGDFWDSSRLEKRKGEIASLIKEKEKAYKTAYRFLSASLEVVEMQQQLSRYCLLEKKMKSFVDRLCASFGRGDGEGRLSYRRTCAFSMKGAVRLSTFEEAKELYGVADCTFISPIFYKYLADRLQSFGYDIYISQSPLYGIAELYLPELSCAFVPVRDGVEYKNKINLCRFADKERMAEVKQKRIFSSKCLSSMLEGAEKCMRDAGELHFSLERIYKEAMDFEGLDRLKGELSDEIVSRLSEH